MKNIMAPQEYIMSIEFFNEENKLVGACEWRICKCVVKTNFANYSLSILDDAEYIDCYIINENFEPFNESILSNAQLFNAVDDLKNDLNFKSHVQQFSSDFQKRCEIKHVNPYQSGLMSFSSHVSMNDVSLN